MLTSSLALLLALVALTGVYAFDPRAFNYTLVLFAGGLGYYLLYARNHLVAKSADEELRLILEAQSETDADSTTQSESESLALATGLSKA